MAFKSTSSSQTIFIEPYCIFCQEATDHVENRKFSKSSSQTWEDHRGTRYTNTESSSFSSPFPTHPNCLKKFEKISYTALLIGIAVPILLFIILGILFPSRSGIFGTVLGILIILSLPAAFVYSEAKKGKVAQALEQKVRYYSARHVQADTSTSSPVKVGLAGSVVWVPEDYKDIQSAIAAVPVGTQIMVRPGNYKYVDRGTGSERIGLIINKPLEIIGVGPAQSIIVSDGMRIQTPEVKIKGITITNEWKYEQISAVEVVFGRVQIENCHITCSVQNGTAVFIGGPLSEVTLSQDKIIAHNNRCEGICLANQSSCLAEDCEVSKGDARSSSFGVQAGKGCHLTLRHCKVHHMGTFGIDLSLCTAVLEDCRISENGYNGVIIGSQVDLTMRDCQVSQNKNRGVLIGGTDSTPSKVLMENCVLTMNGSAGIEIWRGNNPTIRKCRVSEGEKSGIFIYNNSRGLIEDCDIFENGFAGVEVTDGGNPILRNCSVYDGKSAGFNIHDNGAAVIHNCRIHGNALEGIYFAKGSKGEVKGCQINRNGSWAIGLDENSTAAVEECNLMDNGKGAWSIDTTCQVNKKANIDEETKL